MATWTINIPDAQVARVIDGLCGSRGYVDADGDGRDDQTNLARPAFAKMALLLLVREFVKSHEVQQAADAARAAAAASVDKDVVLT